MEPAVYIGIFIPLLAILLEQQQTHTQMDIIRIIRQKRKEGTEYMNESLERFIGKDCMIYTYNYQLVGTVVSVEGNWMTVKTKNASELVNLDYISRIREYPTKKQG